MPKHILVVLSEDPPGHEAEFAAWTKEHVEQLQGPMFKTGQAFRFHPEHDFAFPETVPTRPDYQNLIIYELEEEAVDRFLHPDPSTMAPPPPAPGGVGPHRPDGYLFVAVTPEIFAK